MNLFKEKMLTDFFKIELLMIYWIINDFIEFILIKNILTDFFIELFMFLIEFIVNWLH